LSSGGDKLAQRDRHSYEEPDAAEDEQPEAYRQVLEAFGDGGQEQHREVGDAELGSPAVRCWAAFVRAPEAWV
jgi:hypothetical protein